MQGLQKLASHYLQSTGLKRMFKQIEQVKSSMLAGVS